MRESINVKPNATYSEIRKTGNTLMEWELNRSAEYWKYRKKWEEYPKNKTISKFPIHLDIEITNRCNLKCEMCMRTSLVAEDRLPIGSMEFDFYKHLIKQASEHHASSVKFNFLGEPLLHPDVIEMVAYAKQKGLIEVLFNTNTMLLTSDMSRRLLDAGLDSIFFSVDSPYPEKYNKIRKGSDFNQVKRNIEEFIRIKESGGYKHVQTRVSCVLMDQNEKELEDYKNIFVDLVGIIGFGEYIDREKNYGAEIIEGFACAQLFQRMFVTWDGLVFAC